MPDAGPSLTRPAALAAWLPPVWRLPLALAACALAVAALLSGWLTPRWQAEAQAVEAEHLAVLRARSLAARRAAAVAPASPPPQAQALQWLHNLPPADATAPRLSRLLALAQQHGLAVASTRQILVTDVAVPMLSQRQLTVQLQGSYPALRGWVAAVLQADPALSLDSLQISRQSVAEPLLRATAQATLLAAGAAVHPASGLAAGEHAR